MNRVNSLAQATRTVSNAELERLSDEELMACLNSGCHDALAVLFDRYHRLVLSIALRIVRDPGEAEDVMQTVFIDIFRAVAQFDPSKGSTRTWILQYAYHRAMNRRQYLNTRGFYRLESFEDFEGSLSSNESILCKFSLGEIRHLLKEGMQTLTAPQRRSIRLATSEGLSMQEIADKTGESLVNVRHHYYRGLKKLRSMFIDTGLKKASSNE